MLCGPYMINEHIKTVQNQSYPGDENRKGCIMGDLDWCVRSLIHAQLEEWLQVNYIISVICHQPLIFNNKKPEVRIMVIRGKKEHATIMVSYCGTFISRSMDP